MLRYGLCTVALVGVVGCGDDGGTGSSGGGADDGRYHPPTNGVRVSEDAACQSLKSGRDTARDALAGCVLTTRSCPDLLRAEFSAECLQYDEGSVEGCVDYYAEATDCDALKQAIDDCVVSAFEDSSPDGC